MPEFVLPDNFETYPEARKKAFLTMKELKEQGRRIVGVFCTYTPWELINAADAVAVVLCGIGDDNIPAAEIRPVSYTHLDVYKRQPFPSAMAATP